MKERTIQFNHVRIPAPNNNFAAKGGRTIALEVPTLEEFKAFVPSLSTPLVFKIGIADCSKKDHYNKKLGREISKGRMEERAGFVTLVSETEVQICIAGLTVILRKHPNTDRVYFEEVV